MTLYFGKQINLFLKQFDKREYSANAGYSLFLFKVHFFVVVEVNDLCNTPVTIIKADETVIIEPFGLQYAIHAFCNDVVSRIYVLNHAYLETHKNAVFVLGKNGIGSRKRRYWQREAYHKPSCKSPRTLQKCKHFITKRITFVDVLDELKSRPPRTPLKYKYLITR